MAAANARDDAVAEKAFENALMSDAVDTEAVEIVRNNDATRPIATVAEAVADRPRAMDRCPMDAAVVDAAENTRPNILDVAIVAALDTVAVAARNKIRP